MPEELDIIEQAGRAKKASLELASLSTRVKNDALLHMAEALSDEKDRVLEANAADVAEAEARNLSKPLIKRLQLNEAKLDGMIEGIRQVRDLPDPVGEIISMWRRPNGLQIGQMRVPLGVIGIIYESRPNVTTDVASLCLKTGNAVILRGGSETLGSNKVIVDIISKAAYDAGIPEGAIQLVTNPDRAVAQQMMRLNGLIDVLIPRGGAQLIKTVVENSTVPVIETGVGNCHVYIDGEADLDKAVKIAVNAKVSNPAVCNAMESLLIDRAIAREAIPKVLAALKAEGVEIRGCPEVRALFPDALPATEEDWATEYLDLILAVKVVDGLDEAIDHINKYGTKHSEAIVTENYSKARKFVDRIDAAAVYVNASTRFTDGFEYGFGAEIGISTQKLHARGPMGLKELTTIKYVVFGDGQIR